MDAEALPALDRRKHRTNETLVALTRLLEAARRRGGLDAVTVADGAGLLLAGAGPARLCDELAAWAPIVERGPQNDVLPSCLDALDRRTGRRRIALDGIEIVVTTAGGTGADDELDAVSQGLTRILRPAGPTR